MNDWEGSGIIGGYGPHGLEPAGLVDEVLESVGLYVESISVDILGNYM